MLEHFLTWLVNTIGALGYPGIAVLMAIESSVIPLPSEAVMPPAGYLVATGRMNAALAMGACILGGLAGSYANYWVASRVGRWFFVRYGRWVLVSERSLERSERFFQKHGPIAVVISRLFPVLRHLVSIPAGIARMPVGLFFLYTGVGAGLWGGILLGIGWLIGKEGQRLTHDKVALYSHRAVIILIPAVAVLIAAYVIRHRRRVRSTAAAATGVAGPGAGAGTAEGEGQG
jgi:membrane protein DedA with SNARE-associated domain